MIQLLVDANLDGHAKLLERRLNSAIWLEFQRHLDIHFINLDQAGIDRTAQDDVVWRYCQQNGYYLLSANRNLEAENSLEATIRREGTSESLPVFTLADADRLCRSGIYVDEVVETLLEYLLDEGNYRGTGRLYLP